MKWRGRPKSNNVVVRKPPHPAQKHFPSKANMEMFLRESLRMAKKSKKR